MTNDPPAVPPDVPPGSSENNSRPVSNDADPAAYLIAWDKGGFADVVLLSATRAVLCSTTPSPPGSRIDGRVIRGSASDAAVRFKIHGSKRQADATFLLESRPLDMLKDVRDVLQAEALTAQAAKAP